MVKNERSVGENFFYLKGKKVFYFVSVSDPSFTIFMGKNKVDLRGVASVSISINAKNRTRTSSFFDTAGLKMSGFMSTTTALRTCT